MNDLEEILASIKDESLSNAKREIISGLDEAKADVNFMVFSSAERLESDLIDLANGDISQRDFTRIVQARREKIDQWKNTLSIESQARVQRILLKTMDLVLAAIAPKLGLN